MRSFCHACHRPAVSCFCAITTQFATEAEFALIVHPYEAKSTVGTAWILRRSISNLHWFRSNGIALDDDSRLHSLLQAPDRVPLLLFPGQGALNLTQAPEADWQRLTPPSRRPLFFVIDGTWTQARQILRRSAILRALPAVSFSTTRLSEYGFKIQPHPACLSTVESIHQVIEILAERGWGKLPARREHDELIRIFREMVRFQLAQEPVRA